MKNQIKNCNTLFVQAEKGSVCVVLQFLFDRNIIKPPKWFRGGDAMC